MALKGIECLHNRRSNRDRKDRLSIADVTQKNIFSIVFANENAARAARRLAYFDTQYS